MDCNSSNLGHDRLHRFVLFSPRFSSPMPAIFIDRDGVLIEDKHYLCNADHVALCPGVKYLLSHAKLQGWPVVVITNQSGIARGFFDWDAYERVTNRLIMLLDRAAPLAAIYANGHGPNAPSNSWRKPSPAMLLAAADDLHLDLGRSLLIGDRLTDLQAGARAGLPLLWHVLTGHGVQERPSVEQWKIEKTSEASRIEVNFLKTLREFPCHLLKNIA